MGNETGNAGKSKSWIRKNAVNIVVALLIVFGGGYLIVSGNWHRMVTMLQRLFHERPEQAEVAPTIRNPIDITLVDGLEDTIRFQSDDPSIPPIVEAKTATTGVPLQLLGSLFLDPDALVRVHSRFPGEVVRIGMVNDKGNEVESSDSVYSGKSSNGNGSDNGNGPGKSNGNGTSNAARSNSASNSGNDSKANSKSEHEPDKSAVKTEDSLNHGLRLGDRVHKGQLLAVVWSKEIGEKKSELVDAISKENLSRRILERLSKLKPGVVPGQTIDQARRDHEGDLIDMQRAERTLRSWRITDEEISAMRREAERLHKYQKNSVEQSTDSHSKDSNSPQEEQANEILAELKAQRLKIDPTLERQWAQIEIRSPFEGLVLERNFTVGQIVDTNDDLFKIGDPRRLRVLSFIYEEDLPYVRSLPPEQRIWRIDLKSDPNDKPITSHFDVIGKLIDPQMHTGTIQGPLENPDGRFAPGQFITSTIDRAPDPNLVVVPTSAVIETGEMTAVFVQAADGSRKFTRRRINPVRRGRQFTFISATTEGLAPGVDVLKPGEFLVSSGVLELSVELDNLKSSARSEAASAEMDKR